jgi:flagellar basal-body rod modification protein FlgD
LDLTSLTAASTPTASASSALGLAESFDSFLQLLTTQLTNQDPLEPLDPAQFTEQLVQFTGVEQAIKTNRTLEELLSLMKGAELARSVDYLGAEVVMGGKTIELDASGPAAIHYQLDAPAAAVAVEIQNAAGEPVLVTRGPTAAGNQVVAWDGRDADGVPQPDGLYQFEVRAIDAAGRPLPATPGLSGTVDAVEFQGDRMLLSVDGVLTPIESLTSIRQAAAS